jgi:outer membrane protein assembly factor BamB
MTAVLRLLLLLDIGLLASCGGGGGGDVSTAPPPPALATSAPVGTGAIDAQEGMAEPLSFTVAVTGTSTKPVVPVVTFDPAVFALQGVQGSAPGTYTVRLTTVSGLAVGSSSGQIGFRLCQDAACNAPYVGTEQSFSYAVVTHLVEWGTFQRNAAHTGFIDVTLDPTKFATAWTWSRPPGDPEPIGGINAVATGEGHVFVTKDVYFGQAQLFALDEATGLASWTYAFGQMASSGPAAYAKGTVYVTTTDPGESCVTWAVDAATGTFRFKMPYGCQWSNFFAPTIAGGAVFTASQAGTIDSYAAADGARRWSLPVSAADQSTPAVDDRYAYHYGLTPTGPALNVIDAATGALAASIDDPFASGFGGYSLFSAPMLGSRGNAIAFSGSGFSGRAASSSEQFDSRVLVDYDVATRTRPWRSANSYLTHPALAKGVVYAARNGPATLDAMSEADGHVLWSWNPPAGDASFHRNIVVTRNLVFVSTDANVYAIDLGTHLPVWHYPQPGMLAISANLTLYIATGASISDGSLVAVTLK